MPASFLENQGNGTASDVVIFFRPLPEMISLNQNDWNNANPEHITR